MSMQIVSNKNNRRPNTAHVELVKSSKENEQEATYYAALELVARIDNELTRGVRHYRTKAGVLLTTLDEVVNAILSDNLMQPEVHLQHEHMWVAPQELAA